MAISLLAVLVALGLLHFFPGLSRWRDFRWFQRWSARLGELDGAPRILLTLLPPVLLGLLLNALLGGLPPGALWQWLFAVAVLIYGFGPRELDADVKALQLANDGASRHSAVEALAEDGKPPSWHAGELAEAAAYAALRRRFGVLFWFFVLGPAGVLLYRLAQLLARDPSLALAPSSRANARYVANALDWVPAHLLVFSLALVGQWEAVIGAWRTWNRAAGKAGWYGAEPGFLGAAARADVGDEVEAGDGYAIEGGDPRAEVVRIAGALRRALVAWLSVAAAVALLLSVG